MPFLMNVGIWSDDVAYFNLAGAIDGTNVWTGMTGIVFLYAGHLQFRQSSRNVWPIMAGYMITFPTNIIFCLLTDGTYGLTIGNQSILIGLCHANGMSCSGKYGFGYGILPAVCTTCW